MTDKVLDKINEMFAERYKFFLDNVFPKTHAIIEEILKSPLVLSKARKDYEDFGIKLGRLKFLFDYNISYTDDKDPLMMTYDLTIRYKCKKMLKYNYRRGTDTILSVFHECDWIDKLDGSVEVIQEREIAMAEYNHQRNFKKYCKDFESYCE